ncbi:hypothetical protein [Novosphingobium lentum]|uniref:hypothetical protein n=1 Tax=Novosphingobium lentum TaxID=145287 RepID=UPI000836A56C|nr:hypothetical protein [Novosphingobium lentum]
MVTEQLDAALDRLEQALSQAEQRAARQPHVPDPAPLQADQAHSEQLAADLAALEERHGQLKQAVAQGLRQLDEILAGMPR